MARYKHYKLLNEVEVWKDVIGYEGLYIVSSMGRIKSLDRIIATSNGKNQLHKGKMMKLLDNGNGYFFVRIKGKISYIHRLVAKAFIPNPDNLPEVDHIDTNKGNNKVGNLKWASRKDNCNNELTRSHITEAQKGRKVSEETKRKLSESCKGRKHTEEARRKISEAQYKKVYCIELDRIFNSIKEASNELKINGGHISSCCRGKRKTCGGYHWIYY